MRKITLAAMLLMALAGQAYAGGNDAYAAKHAQQAREAAQLDQQYRTILKMTNKPTQTKIDPWANMRSGDTEQTKP